MINCLTVDIKLSNACGVKESDVLQLPKEIVSKIQRLKRGILECLRLDFPEIIVLEIDSEFLGPVRKSCGAQPAQTVITEI